MKKNKWELKKAHELELWNNKIKLVGEYPLFKVIKNKQDLKIKLQTFLSDFFKLQYVVHLQISK